MSLDTTARIVITAPSTSDGFGAVAVLNDTADPNFAGYCIDATRSVANRQALEERSEAHGVTFPPQWYGGATRTLEIEVALTAVASPALTGFAAAHWHRDQILAATNAMAGNGSLVYTEQGASVARYEPFRREQYPSGPNQNDRRMLVVLSTTPRIYSSALITPSTSPITNAGRASSFPIFTFTPTSTGTVILRNTTLGLGNPTVTLQVGTDYLSTGAQVVVDFEERSVLQSGVYKQGSVVPGGTWWELKPGANSYTTNAGTATFTGMSLAARSAWI